MSVNSGLIKATQIIGQTKAFYRQRIPECNRAKKETVDIDILVTSRTDDSKIMQSIRITRRLPSRKWKWNQLSKFWRTATKVYNTYRKDLTWPHFDNEPRVQKKQQVKDQQSCISGTNPDVKTVFHTWVYCRFIET